jgi:hypothetical protein
MIRISGARRPLCLPIAAAREGRPVLAAPRLSVACCRRPARRRVTLADRAPREQTGRKSPPAPAHALRRAQMSCVAPRLNRGFVPGPERSGAGPLHRRWGRRHAACRPATRRVAVRRAGCNRTIRVARSCTDDRWPGPAAQSGASTHGPRWPGTFDAAGCTDDQHARGTSDHDSPPIGPKLLTLTAPLGLYANVTSSIMRSPLRVRG